METSGDEMGDEESDHGPYCLCRGPDDHRWMICCENCEDWYHGECINLDKSIGESLIEKFICPLCTKGNLVSLYKKTCSLGSCRKPARLGKELESVFCSDEHAQVWWERMLAKLPKFKGANGLDDAMAQDEFMALLQSDLAGVDKDGVWRVAQDPFSKTSHKLSNGDSSKFSAIC
jgi:COMPASS component SPP1